MKKIWGYVKHHVQQDFHPLQYAFVAVFLGVCLLVNYRIAFEKDFLDQLEGLPKLLSFFLTYAFAYYTVLLTYTWFRNEKYFWFSREFLIKSTLVLLVLSIDCSMPYLQPLIHRLAPWELHHWLYKVFHNLIGFAIVLGVLLTYYHLYDRQQGHRYGLHLGKFELKPYLLLLLIMLPLIAMASQEKSFLHQYPMYKTSEAPGYLHVSEWIPAGIYELSYGANFITVEFLFRGVMVIGIGQILGRKAILPMVAAYCFIHFGKPPAEAVSSVLGGYILGVIAFETKSVWGGVLVHIGIAWMMELAAFLAKS